MYFYMIDILFHFNGLTSTTRLHIITRSVAAVHSVELGDVAIAHPRPLPYSDIVVPRYDGPVLINTESRSRVMQHTSVVVTPSQN